MASLRNLLLTILAFTCLIMPNYKAAASRNNIIHHYIKPGYDLAARLEASGGLTECWNALMELKSCTNEIVIFFLNGQANLGPGCCRAIDIITRNCWPAMLTSLGFTAEEGNILRGYCDVSSGPASAEAPSPAASAAIVYQPQVSMG
ncbi:egg cell-secreted protein 1.1 [Melia azedarach]|uniref:Egg cell-secreted protein 1.1 n=1 Tax=Melia azedarach TaxID=155640 RepID=A0ACC1XVK5_MELAZ|nr:egg cell-secreted protein 1.1 [Melia azedarach]